MMLAFYAFDDCVIAVDGCSSHSELWKTIARGIALDYRMPLDVEESLAQLTRAVVHGFYDGEYIHVSDILSVKQLEMITEKFGKCKAIYTDECFTSGEQREFLDRTVRFFAENYDDEPFPNVDDVLA